MEQNKLKMSVSIGRIAFSVITIIFCIAAFICVLCNYLINRSLDWSLYVVGALALAWVTVVPLFTLKKLKFIGSLAVFSIGIIPFLFLIEFLCPVKDWVLSLGIPVTLASLLLVWFVYWLFFKCRINRWYAASITVLFSSVLAFYINIRVADFVGETDMISMIINVSSMVLAALIFFFVGYAKKSKKNNGMSLKTHPDFTQ